MERWLSAQTARGSPSAWPARLAETAGTCFPVSPRLWLERLQESNKWINVLVTHDQ